MTLIEYSLLSGLCSFSCCVILIPLDMRAHLPSQRPQGMRGIFVIWAGQMLSGIASSITAVALPIWIFNLRDGIEAGLAIGLWEFFFFGSYLLFVQFAGVLIDRYDRRMMMLVYDFMSLAAMTVLLVINATGELKVWHLYVASVFQGIGFAFHSPSFSAVVALMVPRRQYVRANGLISLLYDAPDIFGPLLAGVLVLTVGLNGVLAINMFAFIVSIGALLFVEIPPMPHTSEGNTSHGSFFKEIAYGIHYIIKRPGLLGLQLIFFLGNLFSGMAMSVAALYPMILLRTGGDAEAIGTVRSAGALAAVIVGIYISVSGGIKKPVRAILLGWILSSLFGLTLLGMGGVLVVWVIAYVIDSIFDPLVGVSFDTFMQTKVPPDLQGRVFSASDFMTQAIIPVTPLLAGWLGDGVFEPAMSQSGALPDMFGWLVGTGPGSGFGLMILLCGIGGTLVGLAGYLVPALRNVDENLPDYAPLPPVGLVRRINPIHKK